MEVFQITITRIILENGDMGVKLALPEKYNGVEVLGMLEACKIQIFKDMGV